MVIPFYTIIICIYIRLISNMTSTNIIILIIVGPYSIFMIIIITIYFFFNNYIYIVMPDYVIILLHFARTHTRLHACYMTKMICFPDYIISICTSCCTRIIMLLPCMCF